MSWKRLKLVVIESHSLRVRVFEIIDEKGFQCEFLETVRQIYI